MGLFRKKKQDIKSKNPGESIKHKIPKHKIPKDKIPKSKIPKQKIPKQSVEAMIPPEKGKKRISNGIPVKQSLVSTKNKQDKHLLKKKEKKKKEHQKPKSSKMNKSTGFRDSRLPNSTQHVGKSQDKPEKSSFKNHSSLLSRSLPTETRDSKSINKNKLKPVSSKISKKIPKSSISQKIPKSIISKNPDVISSRSTPEKKNKKSKGIPVTNAISAKSPNQKIPVDDGINSKIPKEKVPKQKFPKD